MPTSNAQSVSQRVLSEWLVAGIGALLSMIALVWIVPAIRSNNETLEDILSEQIKQGARQEYFWAELVEVRGQVDAHEGRLDRKHDQILEMQHALRLGDEDDDGGG